MCRFARKYAACLLISFSFLIATPPAHADWIDDLIALITGGNSGPSGPNGGMGGGGGEPPPK